MDLDNPGDLEPEADSEPLVKYPDSLVGKRENARGVSRGPSLECFSVITNDNERTILPSVFALTLHISQIAHQFFSERYVFFVFVS